MMQRKNYWVQGTLWSRVLMPICHYKLGNQLFVKIRIENTLYNLSNLKKPAFASRQDMLQLALVTTCKLTVHEMVN